MELKKNQYSYLRLCTTITITIILLDQLTKILIKKLQPNVSFLLFKIHYTTNTGAGFSLFQNNAFILGLISLAFVIAIIAMYKSIPKTKPYQIATALLLGGAIGNMIDRLLRQEVIDFLGSTFWPSFNIADMGITLGAITIIGLLIKEELSEHEKLNKNKNQ